MNYGAVLQSYALSTFLDSQDNIVEFIDYRSNRVNFQDWKSLFFSKYSLLNPQYLLKALNKRAKFKDFIDTELNLSKKRFFGENDLKKGNHSYDSVVCGSDEIWNLDSIGFDKLYFINFLDNKAIRKISYAASFGSTTNISPSLQEEINSFLIDFNAISVRDNNSLSLIKQCGFEAQKVLDPTFLISYEKITKKTQIKEEYILVYGSLSKSEAEYVRKFSEKNKLNIISIGTHQSFLKPICTNELFDVCPREWLGFFSDSRFVVTKFFHGAIFSILFNKPFIVFNSMQKSVKIKDLLETLDLKNRIIEPNETFSVLNNDLHEIILAPPLSNKKQRSILDENIKYSQDFLKKSLQ